MRGIFAGIDPGKKGALAAFCSFHGEHDGVISAYRTERCFMAGKQYRPSAMRDALREIGAEFVTIEKVGAMPGQGVVSMFSFGRGAGLWEGLVCGLDISYLLVHPATWHKELLKDMAKGKHSSIVAAERLFPQFTAKHKADEAIAEALLIAEFGRRVRQGGGEK